jgi:ferredoxin
VKRDVVSSSNISELRSKVLSCQEEVQKMKEYALELEQDNASLKKVRRAAASRCRLCAKLCPRPFPTPPASLLHSETLYQQLGEITAERDHLMGRQLGQLGERDNVCVRCELGGV